VLLPELAPELAATHPRPRTQLANWLTHPDNPLTARVLVNRAWQWHFGKGLVETANDFGTNGAGPTDPDLLDYLANELIAGGWRLKPLHRLILLSHAYRQTAAPRRLDAEEIRDAMLAISGRLNRKAGGESVMLPVDPDLVNLLYDPKQWQVTPDEAEHDRRTVYLIAKRNLRLPFTEVFDQPDAQTSCPRRERSTHAPQALELLNGPTANRLAEAFARRLEREAGPEPPRQVERAFLLVTGRRPTPREEELAVRFLRTQPLREFALAMFNLNAFLYVH
jgi:hypothetical protein